MDHADETPVRGVEPRWRRRAAVGGGRLAGALLLAVVLLTMVAPRVTAIPYARVPAIAAFVALAALGLFLARVVPRLPERVARRLALPTGIACTAASAAVGFATFYVTTWDSKLIQNIVSVPRSEVTSYQVAYLSRYPNNELLLAMARSARGLGQSVGLGYGTAFMLLQVGLFAVALVGVHRLATLMGGPVAGLIAMVLVTLLVGLSPWMTVPYTDVPSMWTPVWAIYCFVRGRRAGSLLRAGAWVAAGGAIVALGYALKTTPVVVLIAGALWFLGAAVVAHTRRAWVTGGVHVAALAAGMVTGLIVTGPLVTRLADAPPLTPGVAASPWHYVASGIRYQVGPNGNGIFGGYDRPVNSATFGKPTAEQTRISKDMLRAELARRGVVGTAVFEVNKLGFTWGDGMLWAYGEGTDLSRRPVHSGAAFELVQAWNSPGGKLFGARVALTQGLWWLLLVAAAFGWLRGRLTPEALLVLLTLVGIAGFTLLFQGRSRYLLTYVPLLAIAAVAWWSTVDRVRPRAMGSDPAA